MLRYVLSGTGAFPKSMFTNDVESLKNCIKVISNKEMLAMMPEARLSTVGKFEGIQESTYKFLKKMNVPVYVIKINGSYLAKPKWADKLRKGSYVEAELSQIYTPEQLSEASVEEIKLKVDQALDYNEWDWLNQHPEVKYKHKNMAKGLENVLYLCPKCGKRYSFNSDKNKIVCDECGLSVELDNRYQLSGVDFKNIAEWYDWQVAETKKELETLPEFCLKANVELRHLSKDGKSLTRHSGNGVCVFDKYGLRYVGTEDGNQIEKTFKVDSNCRVLFGAGEDFEVYENNELYYFVPEDKRACVEWYVLSELLKKD
jgi:transcription elongation factor Elf1